MSAVSVDDWTRGETRLVDELGAKVARLEDRRRRRQVHEAVDSARSVLPTMTDGQRNEWVRLARDRVTREMLKRARTISPLGAPGNRDGAGQREESPHLHVVSPRKGNGHRRGCGCSVCSIEP